MRQGRGTGTYQSYIPWHRVGRGDPASSGRSHLLVWRQRQCELLSDGEMNGLLFSTMLTNLVDIREQHVLSLENAEFELSEYDACRRGSVAHGTVSIAKQLSYKHPRVSDDGVSELWRMTTDQVLVLHKENGQLELLAVAYKHDRNELTKRQRQLLEIEKQYWNARGVQWILITPDLFEESVGDTLSRNAPWGLGDAVSQFQMQLAADTVKQMPWASFNRTLSSIADQLGGLDLAQRAFWQAVWTGVIPMNLKVGWRPHLPIQVLDRVSFTALNPVISRRSAWN